MTADLFLAFLVTALVLGVIALALLEVADFTLSKWGERVALGLSAGAFVLAGLSALGAVVVLLGALWTGALS